MRFAVVGGGVIGLSIATEILDRKLGTVILFDKEDALGQHASTRNSGVLHSGIYYSEDSLKAKFSVSGNVSLRELCREYDIPVKKTGKLILSRDEQSEAYLGTLEDRGRINGVEVNRFDAKELESFAPGAQTFGSFLQIPSTAIADPKAVISAFKHKFQASGGVIKTNFNIKAIEEKDVNGIWLDGERFDFLINAAGAGSLDLAREFSIGSDYLTTPFLGLYWGIESNILPLGIPLYPVPHPVNPFLGVHLTPTSYGFTKIGPTAIPVLGKEQYSVASMPSLKQVLESTKAFARIAKGDAHSLLGLILGEAPNLLRHHMVGAAAQLLPAVKKVRGWKPLPGGIRAQLVNRNGELVQDFVIEKTQNSLHILNAVSPGWTSSLAFGKWIVEEHLPI